MKRHASPWLALVLLFGALTRAFEDPSQAKIAESAYQESSNERTAISYLTSKTPHQNAVFSKAAHLLESLTAAPSCTRIAAARLVTSCQSFEGKGTADQESYEALDRIRSVYAARLAICELEGAGASVPSPCLPVTLSPPTSKNRFWFLSKRNVPDTGTYLVPEYLLEQCLKALESRPQWWTSYSNNRQNAMVICQASRLEVEKEELLDLHRSILRSSVKLDEGLYQALRNAAMEASQHEAFIQAVQSLQGKLVADMEASQSLFRRIFEDFLHEIELGIDTVSAAVATALGRVQSKTTVLEKEIQNATSQIGMFQQALQFAHQETVYRNQLALRTHEENNLAYRESASVLQLSLQSLVETDMARLSQSMGRLDASLEWLTSRLILILEQEVKMAERLQTMETTMEQSQAKAVELQNAQDTQFQALVAHSEVQKRIQFDAQISQALLDKAATTAANLHAIIDEAATKYKQMPDLHFGGIPSWTLYGILLFIIGVHNMRAAVSLFFLDT
ncbi:hypothetical protein PENDEC_c013G05755 [Penicillium decumbens]|uniref:Nuclear membrane fusion protein Kar5 n=1 Tax=Penicillium decumbens TaxID=69771 RepID=A0A1V6PAV9_PENDC|nr:hypothetical protein PENDEC_c013G05755 [Penicillium decumbens]